MPYVLGDEFTRCIDRFANGSPFGEDAKFDPTYQDLRAEVQKLTAYSSVDGRIDWKSIRKWSIDILASRSKDLTVASYLTLALFYLDGYAGMADGLEILHKYLKDDWDGIFPPSTRPRNRALALEWLVTRLAPVMEERAPRPAEAALLRHLWERLDALQETVLQRLMHDAPSFGDLRSALSGYLADLPEEPAEPEPSPADAMAQGRPGGPEASPSPGEGPQTVSATRPEPRTAAPPEAPPVVPEAVIPAVEPELPAGTPAGEVTGRIRALIPVLRQAAPLAPLPYRLLRVLKWDGVAALPPVNPQSASPGTTRVPAPRPQQQANLERLLGAANWPELLQASEGAFQEDGGTFWLDLQRYTVLALENLGAIQAADVVRAEVVRFLERLDTLPTLWFADRTIPTPGRPNEPAVQRTPFAGEATRQWLETLESLRVERAAAAPVPVPVLPSARTAEPGQPSRPPVEEQAIQDLLAKQQVAPALDLIQTALDGAPGQRARFHIRLTAARLTLQAGQIDWARTLLEELVGESEGIHFEGWEPETAVDLYRLLAICYSQTARRGAPADREKAQVQIEALRRKLFRLDLRAVAALEEALRP